MKSTIDFLIRIYSTQCQNGDYIVLAARKGSSLWRDIPIAYNKNSIRDKLKRFFKEYPCGEYDLYWSPMPYSGNKRRLEYARETKYLAQDIDEYDNPEELNPPPSYIWESSPNKYQGLWELDRYIGADEYTPLNKALAGHIGCDDCFDFCHVYRIPGTVNHKYRNNPKVKMPSESRKIYKPKTLRGLVGANLKQRETKTPASTSGGSDIRERKIYAKYSIPQKVRDLLAVEDITGLDRSSTIWYIENKLHELGMTPNEIIYLVKNSAFNKYRGRGDEESRLRKELDKVISGSISDEIESTESSSLKVSSYMDVMSNHNTFEGWLVKGFWGRRSHGIVAGMPKCFKSTLVHDLAVSVASGTPFLGQFPVLDPGPVVVVQNENADYIMKDRTEKLMVDRGLTGRVRRIPGRVDKVNIEFPPELPIKFINQQGFLITNESHRLQLEKLIEEYRPVLVVLDPLYLMFEGDLNSAKDLNPALNWLLSLKKKYKTSVMLIHHYNKGGVGASKGGARMSGSVFLYGWVESAWYLTRDVEEGDDSITPSSEGDSQEASKEPSLVTLSREFRMAGSFSDLDIHLSMGEIGDPTYSASISTSGSTAIRITDLAGDIENLLKASTSPLTKSEIIQKLGIDKGKLNPMLTKLCEDKRIVSNKEGFSIYKKYS